MVNWHGRSIFSFFCTFFIYVQSGEAEATTPKAVTNIIASIHADNRVVGAFHTDNELGTLRLGVATGEVKDNSPTSFVGIVTFDPAVSDRENCTYWLSAATPPLTCLVLRKSKFQGMTEYRLYPYFCETEDKTVIFAAHRLERTRMLEGRAHETGKILPLKIKTILASRLASYSPVRQIDLPEISVITMERVRLEDREYGPVITGVLNGKWRFELSLTVDEEAQRVRPGALSVIEAGKDEVLVPGAIQ